MANLFDYLDWRGDLPFAAAPLCEVDNLIFSLLSYLDFSDVLPPAGDPLSRAAEEYFAAHPRRKGALGALLSDQIQDLLQRCAQSIRFGSVHVWNHSNMLDEERELQFSATAFSLGTGVTFAAFRGTDDTIVGWKEDFNMAVVFPVPAQTEARHYLNELARQTGDRLVLGGHSKGGNLAVYAAAFCLPEVQRRISCVWSNDGPGFIPEMLADSGYLAIRDRVRSILPRSSIVGMILNHDHETIPIESSAVGALQHDGLTWQVLGDRFVRAEGLSRTSRQAEKTFHNLLLEMSPDQRRQVIDDIFSAGRELGARTLTDLISDGRRRDSMKAIYGKLSGFEKETKDSILRALRTAFRASEDELPEEEP